MAPRVGFDEQPRERLLHEVLAGVPIAAGADGVREELRVVQLVRQDEVRRAR
jgi:hypothetical protein